MNTCLNTFHFVVNPLKLLQLSSIQYLIPSTQYLVSSNQCLVSSIQYLVSSIQYLVSSIQYLVSSTKANYFQPVLLHGLTSISHEIIILHLVSSVSVVSGSFTGEISHSAHSCYKQLLLEVLETQISLSMKVPQFFYL